jgi:hypothetical protein
MSFRLRILQLTLNTSNGSAVAVIPSTTAAIIVELNSLRDTGTLFATASVPAGTYTSATISLESGTIVTYDPTQNPPLTVVNAVFTQKNPTITLSSPLTVGGNTTSAISLDFDMRKSIQFDSEGNIAPGVNTAISIDPIVASPTRGYGELDDVHGFITNVVPANTANPQYDGSFNVQLLSGFGTGGPNLGINLVHNPAPAGFIPTSLCLTPARDNPALGPVSNQSCVTLAMAAPPGLSVTGQITNQILPGIYSEMDGYIDINGNFNAIAADLEDMEDITNRMAAFLGDVVSVTTDPAGNVTQFEFFVREESPDAESGVPLDSTVTVNMVSEGPEPTLYSFPPRTFQLFPGYQTGGANPIVFGPNGIFVGQQLAVHGTYSTSSGTPAPPTIITASQIWGRLQPHDGNFVRLLASSNDQTGAFLFVPCATLFGGVPMVVFTTSKTNFIGVNGLNELTQAPTLLVRGVAFRQLQEQIVGGVRVPAGSLVILARSVHQE